MKKNCPCDLDGVCPYDDFHSGYIGSCEYWCGEEPEEYDIPGYDESFQENRSEHVYLIRRSDTEELRVIVCDYEYHGGDHVYPIHVWDDFDWIVCFECVEI